jgi:glyoxylase-like metal-dependent hydrolase (beta-lactamase superfamily II)/rhodanese-related sulfurtransferase
VKIDQFITESLGDASYLVVSGQSAAVIDPQRDIRPFVAAAERYGATIEFVVETHVHNDYISGGRELADLGAQVAAPRDSGIEFPHIAIGDSEDLEVGGARLRALHAPGHTYEHAAYLGIDEDGQQVGAFTGGSLLMASAGRTDLLGPDDTARLTKLQWESARRLAAILTPQDEVYPTHGAGSFCSASGTTADRHAPFAIEQERNPALNSASFEIFRDIQLANPAPIPGYYRYIAPINRRGPRVFGTPPVPERCEPGQVESPPDDVHVVDVRDRREFAVGHVPGSLLIESGGSMLAYFGWIVPYNAPLILITRDDEQAADVTLDLFRIGYEDVRGYLPFDAWQRAGGDVATLDAVELDEATEMIRASSRPVLDVRFASEVESAPLPGAVARPIDRVHDWKNDLPSAPYLVVCESGYRASAAASLLQQRGLPITALIEGGASDLLRRLRAGDGA